MTNTLRNFSLFAMLAATGFSLQASAQAWVRPVSPQQVEAMIRNQTVSNIASRTGLNHEGQVTARCVAQYGVTYAAAGCVGGQLTADELTKCFNDGIGGRGCFGDNNTLVDMIRGNYEAAQRERGDGAKVIRATTGISVTDIQRHGVLGGQNSDARKLCNAIFGSC